MKKLLLITLFALPLVGISQKRDTSLFRAGSELIKFENQHSAGLMMQLIGSGCLVGALTTVKGSAAKQPLYLAGGALSLVGFVMQLVSGSHVKNAGLIIQGNRIIKRL